MSFFKLGRAKLPHYKNTAAMPPVAIQPPKTVTIPMSQHIGAPANPVCAVGDTVYVGTLIGEASGFVSAPIHSSVSGTVKKIDQQLMANGKNGTVVVIESDGLMTPDSDIKPPVIESFADLSAAARAAGLVGLGGAGFPTSVKLDPKRLDALNTLVLNGAECEPYITSDTRTMIDRIDSVKRGVLLSKKFAPTVPRIVFGIESNKAEAIASVREAMADIEGVCVTVLPSKYPQGAEKIIIHNTTRRIVPEGKLPVDVGVIVMNVSTLAFIADYVDTGMPLVEKTLTLDGGAIANPMNVSVCVGTPIGEIIAFAGETKGEIGKVLYGGPMMGVPIRSLDEPVRKTTNAITVMTREESIKADATACIHCGRCVSACPMGLNPTAFGKALSVEDKTDRVERLEAPKINLCMECGCCSFVCPALRPIVQNNRLAKAEVREYRSHMKNLK